MAAAHNRPTREFELKQDSAYVLFYNVVKTKDLKSAGRLYRNFVSVIKTHSSLSHLNITALKRSDTFCNFCCRIGWMIGEIFSTIDSIPWPEPPPSVRPDVSGSSSGAETPKNLSVLWDEMDEDKDDLDGNNGAENRCSFYNFDQRVVVGDAENSGTGRRFSIVADSAEGTGLSGPPPTMSTSRYRVRKLFSGVSSAVKSSSMPRDEAHSVLRSGLVSEGTVNGLPRSGLVHDGNSSSPRPGLVDDGAAKTPRSGLVYDGDSVLRSGLVGDGTVNGVPRPGLVHDGTSSSPRSGLVHDGAAKSPSSGLVYDGATGRLPRPGLVNDGTANDDSEWPRREGVTPNYVAKTDDTGQDDSLNILNYTIQRLTSQQEQSSRLLAQQNAEMVLAGAGFETFDGSRPEDFKSWLFGLENRLRMTKTTDDAVKVGHLVNCLAGLARRQFHEDLVNPTFYAAVNYLKKKYGDSRYDALKFQQFRSRVQQRGETIESYAKDLKLAFPFQQCDSQQSNLMLMEQLQRGLQEAEYRQYVQERLLNPKKSFDDVVNKLSLRELAKNTTDVKERGRNYDSQHHEARVRLTRHQAQSDKKSIQCYRCQELGHYASTCNNSRVTRSYCEPYLSHEYAYSPPCYSHYQYDAHPYWYQQQYQGQIESQVPKPALEYPPMLTQQQQSVTQSVTSAAVDQDSAQKPLRIGVCRVRSVKIASTRSSIYVNSQKVPENMWHADTGAHCNLVTSWFLHSVEGPLVEKPCSESLTSINGMKTQCKGIIKLAVSIGKLTKQVQFYVIEEFHGEIGLVLGMPALNAFGFSLKNDSGFDLTPNMSAANDENFVGVAKFVALKERGRGAKPLKRPEKKRKDGVYWKKFAGECNFEKRAPKSERPLAAGMRKPNCSSTQAAQTERVKPQPRYKSFDCAPQIKPRNVKQPCRELKCAKAQRMRHEARKTVMKPYSALRNNVSDWSRSDYELMTNSEPRYDPRFELRRSRQRTRSWRGIEATSRS